MIQRKGRAPMPQISSANTTAKLWWLFLHPNSTLIREYPSRGTSQKPWAIQTCLTYPSTFLRAKYGLRLLLPKCSRCPGYSNYTREHHQEVDHDTFHRLLVFIVSAALSQAKSWRTQSSIRKVLPKFKIIRPLGLYPSFASSCKIVLISLTSIMKSFLPNLCATLCFLRLV